MKICKSSVGWVLVLASVACSDEASVGTNRIKTLDPPAAWQELPVRADEALVPTWSVDSEVKVPANGATKTAPVMVGDAEQGLWVFGATSEGEFVAEHFDADGKRLHAEVIEAPHADVGSLPYVDAVTPHALGPTLTVSWTDSDDYRDFRYELLLFDAKKDGAPTRITYDGNDSPIPSDSGAAFRSLDGSELVLTSLAGLTSVSLDGEVQWQSTLELDFRLPDAWSIAHPRGAQLKPGTWAFAANREDGRYLVTLTEDGEVEAFDAQWSEDRRAEPTPWHVALELADNAGELVLVSEEPDSLDGDILVHRVDLAGRRVRQTHWMQRLEYLALAVNDASVDASDNVYVATATGPRGGPSEDGNLLCRIPTRGRGSCKSMPDRPYALQATRDGVLYALSERGLSRYDWAR